MKIFFQKFWPILFFALIFLILFYKVFILGQVFIEGDNFYLNIPAKYFLVEQITSGHLPLWNPYLFLGIPYLADFNLGTLNPTNLIYFLFPVPRALTLLTVLDFFGLSVGMYLLLRNFKLSKISSVFGAVVMSLSGMPFILLGNMTFMQVIVYIPFIFLVVRKFCEKKTLKWFLFLILIQFFQFISGHPQETYYTMLFVAAYMLFFFQTALIKRIGIVALYILSPLFLGSIQLIPFLEYIQHANRPVGSVDYAGWGGLSLPLLTTFIFPTFYGSHLDGTWWGKQQVLIGFMGIPTLILIYIGIRFSKFKEKIFIIAGGILTFILAFGALTPIFYIFYYFVPGWKLFRAPSGILVFFTFFAAIVAAFGVEYLFTYKNKFIKLGKILVLGGFVLTIFAVVVYFFANKKGFWRNFFLSLQQHYHVHFLNTILFYDTIKIQQIFQGIIWNILFVGIFIFLTGIILTFSKKTYQAVLLLFITVAGFFIVNPKVMLLAPLSYYDTSKAISSVLQPALKGRYRIFSVPVNLHQERQHLPPANYFYVEGQANLAIHQYDNNIESGLYQIAGYTSLVPGSFAKFVGAKDAATNVTNINFSLITQQKFNLSSVRYVISHEPIQNYSNIPLQLVSFDKGKDYIYENATALPRIYVHENPKNPINLEENDATKISFTLDIAKASHVIVANWYYPGWKAYVNGKAVPITSYFSTFQKIAIPQGKSFVKIVYDPLSLKIGLVLTVIGLLGWIGALMVFGKKKI